MLDLQKVSELCFIKKKKEKKTHCVTGIQSWFKVFNIIHGFVWKKNWN